MMHVVKISKMMNKTSYQRAELKFIVIYEKIKGEISSQ